MTTKSKQLPHESRKGEAALSDFAEYVEKQQSLRFPSSSKTAGKGGETVDHHAELDDLLDSLDLSDSGPRIRLRELLLSADDESLRQLVGVITERLAEGHGETVFEIGFENNGDSMLLTRDEWDVAYKRLLDAAKQAKADCQLLLTKNVGGDVEGKPTAGKDKSCSGKIMVRQVPSTAEEVIETRIAVVGNGRSS
jgi:GTPase